MATNYQELLTKIEAYVNLFYREHEDAKFFYHNQSHTANVLGAAKKIAGHYQLDDHSYFIVCAATCFHDTGYFITKGESHELKSAELAQVFLNSIGVNEEDIAAIKSSIMATKMPQNPQSLPEKIICDADLFNLGTEDFRENNKLLKKEREALTNSKISSIEWRASTISMLETHHYHTDYCQLLLNKTKAENVERLKTKQEEKLSKAAAAGSIENIDNKAGELIPGIKPAKQKKPRRPVKGIETMFRTSSSNNVRISVMADNKAHIMISVNSIIISVVLGLIVGKMEENKNLLIPTIILLMVNVTTIIYAVLATRPKVTGGVFTEEQVKNKSVNLLFFGSFYNMNFKEYDAGVKAMMADSDFLYGSLTKDIFWQGKVLGRKYRLLRISYTIFMYGIIISVLAFSAAFVFFR